MEAENQNFLVFLPALVVVNDICWSKLDSVYDAYRFYQVITQLSTIKLTSSLEICTYQQLTCIEYDMHDLL